MLPWSVHFDSKVGVYRHTTVGQFGHSLLTPLVGNVFGTLGIPVTLWRDGEWLPIHSVAPSIIRFEVEHGLAAERNAYNERLLAAARKRRATTRGEHAGYSDLFVPIVVQGDVVGILVTGPFATTMPSSVDVLDRWRWLTGRLGHPADPEFAWYLRETLDALVLDPERALCLERLLGCFAQLMAGEGRAHELANEANMLRVELERARFVERVWHSVQMMIDERSPHSSFSATNTFELRKLGLTRVIDQVSVGLIVNRSVEPNPVDETIRRNAFQRRAVELARDVGNVLAGQVGDHGVVFLCGSRGSAAQKKQKLRDLVERASSMARRHFALSLHCGAATADESMLLSQSYQAALAAAESALIQGSRLVTAEHGRASSPHSLWDLRDELSRIEERPALLAARFERYLEAVSIHCGHRVEPSLAHLEVGFEDMAVSLLKAGVLEAKGLVTMQNALSRAAAAARNMNEVFAAYRRAFADMSDAVERPVPARQDRSLRRAVEYIHQHHTKPLRIEQVARVAGFTRSYFSKLFIKRERMPFEDYVMGLRLERSQQLLTDTKLRVTRVAELSGFNSPQYFCRVFRRALGMTPREFRRTPQRAKRARNESPKTNSPKYKRGARDRR